jgi:membrane-associated phospholipid phosphatase
MRVKPDTFGVAVPITLHQNCNRLYFEQRDWFMLKMRHRKVLETVLVFVLSAGVTPVARGQNTASPSGCGEIAMRLPGDLVQVGHGMAMAPRNAIRPSNLKWELPIAATAGIFISSVDLSASRRIQSLPFQTDAIRGSNIGIGIELGTAGLMYALGCTGHRSSYAANTGWTALEAMGAANGITLLLKTATNRQYAYKPNSQGEFWEGGKSFPSGHAATSFAFAAVIAHRYPQKRWLKWSAYGLATGVSLVRLAGKRHFPSDTLVGATVGYITGTYLAKHTDE